MGQLRIEKIQEFIKQEISKLILSELKDKKEYEIKVNSFFASCSLAILKLCCRHWLCSPNASRPLPATTMLPPPSYSCWHNLLIFPGFIIL